MYLRVKLILSDITLNLKLPVGDNVKFCLRESQNHKIVKGLVHCMNHNSLPECNFFTSCRDRSTDLLIDIGLFHTTNG